MTDPVPSPSPSPSEAPSVSPPSRRCCVMVCQNRSCQRSGSAEVLTAFQQYQSSKLFVCSSDCLGQCGSGPTVKVAHDNTWYCRVKPEDVPEIYAQHLQGGKPIKRLLHPRFHPQFDAHSFSP